MTDQTSVASEEVTMHQTTTEQINEESEDRTTGQVKWFNDVDGYGFIKPTDNSDDIFVHISDLEPAHNNFKPKLFTGEYVSFGLATNGESQDGSVRLKAVHVKGAFAPYTLLCDHGDIEFKNYSRIGFGTAQESND